MKKTSAVRNRLADNPPQPAEQHHQVKHAQWGTLALGDPLFELLPTHEMSWPNFKNLLKRVAREVNADFHAANLPFGAS